MYRRGSKVVKDRIVKRYVSRVLRISIGRASSFDRNRLRHESDYGHRLRRVGASSPLPPFSPLPSISDDFLGIYSDRNSWNFPRPQSNPFCFREREFSNSSTPRNDCRSFRFSSIDSSFSVLPRSSARPAHLSTYTFP